MQGETSWSCRHPGGGERDRLPDAAEDRVVNQEGSSQEDATLREERNEGGEETEAGRERSGYKFDVELLQRVDELDSNNEPEEAAQRI